MRKIVSKSIEYLISQSWSWNILNKTLLRLAGGFQFRRTAWEARQAADPVEVARVDERIAKDLTVKNGIFKGLRYPDLKSSGSMLYPKLLGSYESELNGVFEEIFRNTYTTIIDVGCAEGYYAVGLARRFPNATVYAFDVNPAARELCRAMAAENGVEERVVIGEFCRPDTLLEMDLQDGALIICDCEGYETTLFNDDVVRHLKTSDIVVELHDCDDIGISSFVEGQFKFSHNIRSILSVDDIQKAKTYQYPELEGCSLPLRHYLLAEKRRSIMEWFYIRSRKQD